MKIKQLLFLVAISLLMLISACSEELTSEQIQQKIIEANTNINTYSAQMQMIMNMKTEVLGNQMNIKMETNSEGDIDRTNRKTHIKSNIKTDLLGINIQTDTYAENDVLYIKSMGTWLKMNLDDDVWIQQDQISQVTELTKSGTIEMLKDEKIGKNSYYVFKITPELKKMVELAMKQQQNNLFFENNADYEDMIKSYSMTIWVNKKSFVIEKSRTEMNLLLNSENMGGSDPEKVMESDIEISSVIDVTISNINKEFDIVIPAEAKNAIDYNTALRGQATPGITGNTIFSS